MVKIKKCWRPFAVWISMFCLGIAGCTLGSQNPVGLTAETKATLSPTTAFYIQTAAVSPTKTLLPTLTFTPSPVPIVLPAVTMSPQEAENALRELLRTNGDCTGKCFAGIRPDDMTAQEAIDQMARWGMLTMDEGKDGSTFISTLYLDPRRKHVDADITLTLRKEAIDAISFYIPRREGGEFLGADVWRANREAWRAFQFDELLKAYGIPSFVGFMLETRHLEGRSIGYTLIIQYEQMNLEIGIGALANSNGKDVFLCPSKDPHNLGVEINPKPPLRERQQTSPITWQALTGTNLEEFYRIFIGGTSPDGCFTTTFEKIIALDPYFR